MQVVEIFIASDLRRKPSVLLGVQLGFYFLTKKEKNGIKMSLYMTVHICNVRHMHTIWRASHAVMIYTASNCNIKVVFTSSLQQDTFEHMMSYTYLPLQLLPTCICSNIQTYTLQIPKIGKTATHRAWHQGTVPRDAGACSQPHRALATCRGAGMHGEQCGSAVMGTCWKGPNVRTPTPVIGTWSQVCLPDVKKCLNAQKFSLAGFFPPLHLIKK